MKPSQIGSVQIGSGLGIIAIPNSNADWVGWRLTNGYIVCFGSNLISWSSRNQAIVSRSNIESKYKSLANSIVEVIWVQSLQQELFVSLRKSPILWCANLGAMYLIANPFFNARTKHIKVDYHFIRERVACKLLEINFISSQDQIADIFTKALMIHHLTSLKYNINLVSTKFKLREDVKQNDLVSRRAILYVLE